MRFLIIDDESKYREVLHYHLEVEWPEAIVEELIPDASDGLPRSCRLEHYDMIFLGHPLKAEDRLEWLKRLRGYADCPPIVLFADPSDEFLAVDALKAGAASYFPKSGVTHHRLIQAIRDEVGAGRPSAPSGDVVGRTGWEGAADYKFTRTLHANDVASVYLAESQRDGGLLAFKVIRYVGDSGSDDLFVRFIQEYEVVAALSHPNVVQIHDLGIADDHAYIAMEYLAAGSLADRLNGALSPDLAFDYLHQIGSALEAVHRRGVLHRDLKPANIMFREDGTLALIDFGLAKQVKLTAALTGAGQIFGTPYYMSPEQGHAEPTDARSDLYSLGCILYEMLTGSRPFVASTAMGVIYQHAHAERPKLNGGLERFQAPLEKLFAIRPEDRFQSATAMLSELAAFKP